VTAGGHRERWLAGLPLCPTTADTFDRFVEPAIFRPWADLFVSWLGVRRGDSVLDVGSGTGAVARRVERCVGGGGRVIALDAKREMLIRGARASARSIVCWVQADAQSMPFAAEQFDVIMCQHVLPLVPDRHAALREMRRVLRPEGALGVATWGAIEENPASAALADVIERHVSTELAARYRAGPFGYDSTHSLREDLTAAGLAGIDVVKREISVSFSSVPLFARVYIDGAPFIEASAAARQRLLDELETRLSPYCHQGRLTYPTTAYLARATAPAR
jgi:ubiquinone/menaquinone biosynthesis C-methylase UbiE